MRHRLLIPAVLATTLAVVMLVFIGVLSLRHTPDTTAVPSSSPSASASTAPSASPTPTSSATTPTTPGATASTAGPSPGRTTPTGPPAVPRSLLGKDVEVIPTSQPVVALTFDAGSNVDGLPAILQALAGQKIRATFFLTGSFATRHPSAVRSIVAAGHRLGNHSATHPYFTQKTDAQIRTELTEGQRLILAAGGTDTRPLFRFPYGDRNARTIAAVNGAGYGAVRWTVDTLGWKGTSQGITVQQVIDRTLGAARAGEIVLMHVGSNPDDHTTLDAQALPAIIAGLRARGYHFVTLDALLG